MAMVTKGQSNINHQFGTNFSKDSKIVYSVPFAIYADSANRQFVKKRMKLNKQKHESYIEHKEPYKGDRITFMKIHNLCHLLVGYNNGSVELRDSSKLKVRFKSYTTGEGPVHDIVTIYD